MLLANSDMCSSPVAAADLGERIGTVVDVAVDPSTHTVLAFLVKLPGWFARTKFASPHDVIEYDPHALIVSAADTLVEQSEIVRAHQLLHERHRIINRVVVTEAGVTIGRVTNFAIDTETAGVVRYSVRSRFGPERIIPTTSIIRVTANQFVIRDERLSTRASVRTHPLEETA